MVGYGDRNNKKGSIAVFFCMIMVAVMASVILIVQTADRRCSESFLDGVLVLAGRSILSEYDVRLKEDYGIFAFRATTASVAEKLSFYLKENQGEGLVSYDAAKVGLGIDLDTYSIINPDLLEEEIVTAAKYGFIENMMAQRRPAPLPEENRAIKNQRVINSLPSAAAVRVGFHLNLSVLKGDVDLRSFLPSSGNLLLTTNYIMSTFGNRLEAPEQRERFFNNEVEYIISGQFSDSANAGKVRQYIVEIRTPINTAKIYADPERMAAAAAMAAAATGGTATPAAIFAIVLTWAIADSQRDADLLLAGDNVDGLDYGNYLMILLALSDRETKLLRVMDLIQINLKASYYEGFLIAEHYFGFRLSASYMGKKYDYAQQY